MFVKWQELGQAFQARWFSSHGAKPPKTIQVVYDDLSADQAHRLASEGVGLLWRGDYHNARQLLMALNRRVQRKTIKPTLPQQTQGTHQLKSSSPQQLFHQYRHQQAQALNVMHKLVLVVQPDRQIELPRAPCVDSALQALTVVQPDLTGLMMLSLKDLQGIIGSYEWSKKGVEIAALGEPPNNRIYPAYGVFSPIRGEYVELVAQAPLPQSIADSDFLAVDVGTGTGVLAAVLARRGVPRVIATDSCEAAIQCAQHNLALLGLASQVECRHQAFFPQEQADLIVCNPPWLPVKARSSLDAAVYDPDHRMLKGFLSGLNAHLKPGGRAWLILSDLAELLELRPRNWLQWEIEKNGLICFNKLQCKPQHHKATDRSNPLYGVRKHETTTLWVLEKNLKLGVTVKGQEGGLHLRVGLDLYRD